MYVYAHNLLNSFQQIYFIYMIDEDVGNDFTTRVQMCPQAQLDAEIPFDLCGGDFEEQERERESLNFEFLPLHMERCERSRS